MQGDLIRTPEPNLGPCCRWDLLSNGTRSAGDFRILKSLRGRYSDIGFSAYNFGTVGRNADSIRIIGADVDALGSMRLGSSNSMLGSLHSIQVISDSLNLIWTHVGH